MILELLQDNNVIYGSAAVAVVAILAANRKFIKRDVRSRRLRMLQERRAELRGDANRLNRRRQRSEMPVATMRRVVKRLELYKSQGVAQAQTVLMEAGWRSKDAMVIYLFASLVLPLCGAALGVLLFELPIWNSNAKMMKIVHFASPIALIYIGLKLPMWVAASRRSRRYRNIRRALSDTLDLMTICAEAGLTLNVAFDRVSRELGTAYPEMAEELALTAVEMGLLPEREKVFSNFTDRVRMAEIRGIVNVLVQTEKYGTPVAQALRVLSAEFREQRMLAAENKAAKLGPMMTVPMICFILPTMFIVVMSPAIIRVTRMMAK